MSFNERVFCFSHPPPSSLVKHQRSYAIRRASEVKCLEQPHHLDALLRTRDDANNNNIIDMLLITNDCIRVDRSMWVVNINNHRSKGAGDEDANQQEATYTLRMRKTTNYRPLPGRAYFIRAIKTVLVENQSSRAKNCFSHI